MLTQERLKELIHYDPETGLFTWAATRPRAKGRAKAGKLAGGKSPKGYWRIYIDGKRYQAQRLAVLYMTGAWPVEDTDHNDLDRGNNKWINLREATGVQNKANTRVRKDNKLGLKGVHKNRYGVYIAQIQGAVVGRFDCPAAASFAYQIAADKAFGEFARPL